MKSLALALFSSLIISACGGGGDNPNTDSDTDSNTGGDTQPVAILYSGLESPAVIDDTNAEAIGLASTEAAVNAVTQAAASESSNLLSGPLGVSVTVEAPDINHIMAEMINSLSANTLNLPSAITVDFNYINLNALGLGIQFCGGSISINSELGAPTVSTFFDLCVSDPELGNITLNGTVIFSSTTDYPTSFQYLDFTVNDGSSIQTINMTVTCTSSTTCTIATDYMGADQKVYRIIDLNVSSDGFGTYSITATFYHPDYGEVLMTGTNLTFGCANGLPDGGEITYSSSNGTTGTITFYSNCTYDGVENNSPPPASYTGSWLN